MSLTQHYPARLVCRLLDFPRCQLYRAPSDANQEDAPLREALTRLAGEWPTYGYRRLTALLRREGWTVNAKRVRRLMAALGLHGAAPVRRKRTTDSNHDFPRWPNLVAALAVVRPDQVWVADITYIRLQEEFAYLAIVLDAFSRRVIGWALETHLEASLAVAALAMALIARRPAPGSLIHHSDRGIQYACGDYAELLRRHDIAASMSRVGNPYDNATAESFMKTLKQEEVNGQAYRDVDHARSAIGTFLEEVYNRHRLHSALAYRPPVEFEANLHPHRGAMTTASHSLATALWGARSLAACSAEPIHQPGSAAAAQQTPDSPTPTCP